MPKLLLDRLRSDSVAEFRLAANHRFEEANLLYDGGQRTVAIYLFGYVVEMELKAAYFALAGFTPRQPILIRDLQAARSNARQLGVAWLGDLHDVAAWAGFLVYLRQRSRRLAYPLGWDRLVLSKSREVSRIWHESLRYHANLAYPHEVRTVRAAAEWFLEHENDL